MRALAWAVIALALAAGPAAAQEGPLDEPTEKLSLKPHRIKGQLLGYGYTLGEFTGEVRSTASSVRAPTYSSDKARTTFTFSSPRHPQVTVRCAGGQSHRRLAWIQFNTKDLAYVCEFEGGPPDAAFALALSDGSVMQRLYQPQRAAELTFGGVTLRAETRHVKGALPFSGGAPVSYRIGREDGRGIAAMLRGALRPTFHLPPEGAPERDAAALMALTLFFFADPGVEAH